MSDTVQMPALGESVTEGTVTRWLKQVGDSVQVDEPLLEVSTDKVDTEIPSPFTGTLLEILVGEDETVEVGAALARIGAADEAGGSSAPAPEAEAAPPAEEPAEQPADAADSAASQQAAQVPAEVEEPSATPSAPAQSGGTPSGDAQDVTLPALGESVTEGTVTRWLKQVGESVEVDEPLLEVSTDKVDTEIPSPVAGTVVEILVGEDETAQVGAVLARVGSAGAAPTTSEAPASTGQAEDAAAGADHAGPASVDPSVEGAQHPAAPPADAEARVDLVQSVAGDEGTPQTSEPVSGTAPSAPAAPSAAPAATAAAQPAPAGGGYLTPLVRKLAADKGVDLGTITGTGVGGRIRKEDVLEAAERAERERAERERAAAAQVPAPAERAEAAEQVTRRQRRAETAAPEVSPLRGTTEKASRLRQIIASRMVESMQSMAQLTTVVEVDVTKVARLRARAKDDFKAREGVGLSYLPFFVLAATEALKAHPKVNGVLTGDQITYHGQENVGIAVDTDRGLVVPVIRDAGDLNLAGIARKIADLAARTRANKVTPDELSGATFTVTNTGWAGALFDTPIVPVGTSAILGTGAIVKRPVVATDEDGSDYVAIRTMCYLSLSYDHRLVDGADASRYLATVKKRLEEGDFESELGL